MSTGKVGARKEKRRRGNCSCSSRSTWLAGRGLQATITNTSKSWGDKVGGERQPERSPFLSGRSVKHRNHLLTPFHSDQETATAMDFSQFNDAERNHLQRVMEQKQVLLPTTTTTTTTTIPRPTSTPTHLTHQLDLCDTESAKRKKRTEGLTTAVDSSCFIYY